MNRQDLTNKYLKSGQIGLEVAGLHNPWPLPDRSFAVQVDLFDTPCLRLQYPEMGDIPFTQVHVIDDATYLHVIPDNSMEFLCSSHVLEHVPNVIRAVENWLRVVKPGGYILLAVPLKEECFDRDRTPTTWQHLLDDYYKHTHKHSDVLLDHYHEYFDKVDKLSGTELEDRVNKSFENNDHIHFHCWDREAMKELFQNLTTPLAKVGMNYLLRHLSFEHHECLVVIQKL